MSESEELQDSPPTKVKPLQQPPIDGILEKGQEIMLGNYAKENIGDSKCKVFPLPTDLSSDAVVQNQINPRIEAWNLDGWKGMNNGESMTVLSNDDPFDTKQWSKFPVRHIASIVREEFPNQKPFHARQLHYRLLQKGLCFPQSKHKNGIMELGRYDGTKKSYNELNKWLKIARYAGLIPFTQQVDKRNTSQIEPSNFELVPSADPKDIDPENQSQVKLDFHLQTGGKMKVEVEAPVIIIYTEKSEITHVLKELAERYYITYFVGQGHASLRNAYDMYEFVKAHGKSGVILTLTDYDPWGQDIVHSLARKIQFHVQTDQGNDAPSIVVYPFKLSYNDVNEFEALGVTKQIKITTNKIDRSNKYMFIYELVALELLAVTHNLNLTDYLDLELRRLFFYDASNIKKSWLISRKDYKGYLEKEKKRMFKALTKRLHDNIEKTTETTKKWLEADENFGFITGKDGTSYQDFEQKLKDKIEQLRGYKLLKNVTDEHDNPFEFHAKDLTSKQRTDTVENEFGFHEQEGLLTDLNSNEPFELRDLRESDKLKMLQFDLHTDPEVRKEAVLYLDKDNKYNVRAATNFMNEFVAKKKNAGGFKPMTFEEYQEEIRKISESRMLDEDTNRIKDIASVRHSLRYSDINRLKDQTESMAKDMQKMDQIVEKSLMASPYGNYMQWIKKNLNQRLDGDTERKKPNDPNASKDNRWAEISIPADKIVTLPKGKGIKKDVWKNERIRDLLVDHDYFKISTKLKEEIKNNSDLTKHEINKLIDAELKEKLDRVIKKHQKELNKKRGEPKPLIFTKMAGVPDPTLVLLKNYFDKNIPFYKKHGEALTDAYIWKKIDKEMNEMVHKCENTYKHYTTKELCDNLQERADQLLAYKPKN